MAEPARFWLHWRTTAGPQPAHNNRPTHDEAHAQRSPRTTKPRAARFPGPPSACSVVLNRLALLDC